jgi:hypothetical protein
MGVGEDWADKMAEEKEAARLRKRELRELRLGMYKVAALLVCNKLTQILKFPEKHKEIKDKWKSPFVFVQENSPSE